MTSTAYSGSGTNNELTTPYGSMHNWADTDTGTMGNRVLDVIGDTANAYNSTNDNTLAFSGTTAPGTQVEIFNAQGQSFGSFVSTTGAWRILTTPIADGAYDFSARFTDAEGHTASTAPIHLIIKQHIEDASLTPTFYGGARHSGGTYTSDSFTKDGTLYFEGKAEANTMVELYIDHVETHIFADVNANGDFSIDTSLMALGTGQHALSVRSRDRVGNSTFSPDVLSPTIVNYLGTSAANRYTGGSGDDWIYAGRGTDLKHPTGGADTFSGGAGNDVFIISDLSYAHIDGGNGIDTLKLDGSVQIDANLKLMRDGLSGIEVLDLRGASAQTAQMDMLSVMLIAMAGTSPSNTFTVLGDANDTVLLSDHISGTGVHWDAQDAANNGFRDYVLGFDYGNLHWTFTLKISALIGQVQVMHDAL